MAQDEIFDIIEKERTRQVEGLELIASENYVSDNVLKAAGSILTNKYAEGYPGRRYYGGCEFVDQSENLAIDRLKKLFGAEYVNVQPHSGSQANAAVYLATLKPGDPILGLDLSHGGHLTHGSPVSSSGILYDAHFYGVHRDTGTIDYEAMRKKALEVKPKMIIAGASAYTRDMDFKKFREVADEVGALLMADIAHPAGLIARGLLNNPMEHCHFVTSTTHKTLRGPRGGIIMMGKDFENPWGEKTRKGDVKMMSNLLNMAVFPGSQGGPLEHIIAAKAVAFGEALTDGYLEYIKQVQKNAAALAEGMVEHGYDLVSGGTDNHLILVDLRNKDITGREAEKVLEKADITCNKNMVPFDDKSPFTTSGIRLGSPAVTTRGLKEEDMKVIADLIDEALMNKDNDSVLNDVSKKVVKMMGDRPLFKW